tara:strand:- start:1043 stop:1144 length:102 start_codon:yes stop_codon:yes gene_type:complete
MVLLFNDELGLKNLAINLKDMATTLTFKDERSS